MVRTSERSPGSGLAEVEDGGWEVEVDIMHRKSRKYK